MQYDPWDERTRDYTFRSSPKDQKVQASGVDPVRREKACSETERETIRRYREEGKGLAAPLSTSRKKNY